MTNIKNKKFLKLISIFKKANTSTIKNAKNFKPKSLISFKIKKYIRNDMLLKLFNKTSKTRKSSIQVFNIHEQVKLIHKAPKKTHSKIPPKPDNITTSQPLNFLNIIKNPSILTLAINTKKSIYLIKQIKNIQINTTSKYDDYYSINFFNLIDPKFKKLLDIEKVQYIKNHKLNVIETFNRLNLYKKFHYSTKDFKKSYLEEILVNNKSINRNILKVYCDLFGLNFVFIDTKENTTFYNRFNKSRATYILHEDMINVYSYLINNKLIKGYDIFNYIKLPLLKKAKYMKLTIGDIRNYANMLNISSKKMGKIRKINKTKDEIIHDILS
tara:strand:- start:24871 stop:25851 length:981 start_codon:yes stop_codon:yes gene_type:complete